MCLIQLICMHVPRDTNIVIFVSEFKYMFLFRMEISIFSSNLPYIRLSDNTHWNEYWLNHSFKRHS